MIETQVVDLSTGKESTEKRFYIKKIREIVNDLTFNNKKEFEQLNSVLKEIQKDVLNQNKRIIELESKVSNGDQMKNELANMLIQRMMNDSSKKTLKRPNLIQLLEEDGQDKEDDRISEMNKPKMKMGGLSGGKRYGAPPKKGPMSQGMKDGGMTYNDKMGIDGGTSKGQYDVQVKKKVFKGIF